MRFLLDEMFPPSTCEFLLEFGHDAVHVNDCALRTRPDQELASRARAEDRVLVTENVADFATLPDLVVVCVRKSRLPVGGMAEGFARAVDTWARANPEPYAGLHWPT